MKSGQTECGGWTRGAGGAGGGEVAWLAEQRNFWVAERGKMWYN